MIGIMYDIPSRDDVDKIIITPAVVTEHTYPILLGHDGRQIA